MKYRAVVAWDGGIRTGLYEADEIEAEGAVDALNIAEEILMREDPPEAQAEMLTVTNLENPEDTASLRFRRKKASGLR